MKIPFLVEESCVHLSTSLIATRDNSNFSLEMLCSDPDLSFLKHMLLLRAHFGGGLYLSRYK